jgi:3-hydroxyisobutyrate dehydrogenase-like beta-hydroxyacid dehydrogenase
MKMKMMKVGIVGLGLMGRGVADNFIKKGHEVFLWNRTKSALNPFLKKGAVACKTPAEVAQLSDITFEVTSNDESSRSVWFGKQGILNGAKPKSILVASATLSAKWTDELIEKCKKKKLSFLDIPLTGGRIGAETGNLTMLCGGDEKVLNRIKPTLKAVAKNIYHFGPAGHGMRYKLILNFLQGLHIIGFGQAMKIAKDNKMNLEKVSEALADRPGGAITEIARKTYFKDPKPITFSIEWITKDLSYAKKLTGKLDVSLLDEVLSEYKKAVKKGYSNNDWARINNLRL